MLSTPPPEPLGRTRRLLALLVITVLAVVSGPLEAAGQPAQPAGSAAVPGSEPAAGGTYRVTLLTGDVAVVQMTGDGSQAAWLEPAPDGPQPAVVELDGQLHVIPAEAEPYLTAGVLDDRLFNVTYLVEQGYHDAARDDLPLLLESPDPPAAGTTPAAPAGTRKLRELTSIGAVSVTADKSRIRSVWESLRGPAAQPGGDGAELAGGGKVWLNGTVQTMLSDSVAQVGAPAAWEAGLDGSGTTVAVLDTGYDPAHPDLAGRVIDERNFTDPADPETAVDGNGHGTHVAATVAGSGAASGGDRPGVAPGADLLVGKVLNDQGNGLEDWIIAGMEWAVEQDAQVVNLSLGTPFASDGTDPMSQAVDRLTESSGALFVVAAGNSGPGAETVGSPGAASHALTVGAVTKSDAAADFSSRGPRLGDGAVKPEIVAPGVGIVAARARGTSLGNLLDEHYTSLNGTSMATPHVAGAAAILAQQHPDWRAAEIKARLASTSRWLPDQPVTFQGGGRLDVAAAVTESVTVSPGVVSLGRVSQTSDPVSRTLRYHNPSGEPVRVLLSADVTGTGSDGDRTPALRLGRRVLTVPAGGEAGTTVSLLPGLTVPGGYAGRIVAQVLGGSPAGTPEIHTVLSLSVEGPLRTLAIEAVDRQGQPASGPVDLWSADTGEWTRAFLADGAATVRVPDGRYSLVASIEQAGLWFRSTVHTIAGDPELMVTRDRTLRYDARDASPLRVETPQEADLDRFVVLWHRSVGDRTFSTIISQGLSGEAVFALKSPRVRTGSFRLATEWQLAQPLLTAEVVGPAGFPIESPRFASTGGWIPSFVEPMPFVGDETLPLVDAGEGTAEEFAEVAAKGAVALVSRRAGFGGLREQSQAAHAAGAAVLLAANTQPDIWRENAWDAPLPVYTIGLDAGQALRDALSADPAPQLRLVGLRDSSYLYELVFVEPDRIPAGRVYQVAEDSLAAVQSDYRQNSQRMRRNEAWIPYLDGLGVANILPWRRNAPGQRTDYVTADGVQWQRFAQPGEFANVYWTTNDPQRYAAGETRHQLWWGPLVHPAVPPGTGLEAIGTPVARFRDAIRINLPHYSYGGSLQGTIFEQLGDVSELTLRREGEVVGKSTWPTAQFTVPPDEGEFELDLQVVNGPGNFMDTSVRTESTWRFRSARPEGDRHVLPLVQLEYDLPAGPYNDVPAGAPHPLFITPGYQPGATGPGGFAVTVEISYDDGETWASAPVEPTGGRLRATVPAASGDGFGTVRVVATDSAGNRLTQRIDRAWRVGTGGS